MEKIRLTAVSYLNTKPFIYGIYRSALSKQIELSLDIPSVCAQKLAGGRADIALAPVAIIPDLPEAYLVSDYCIGATGTVKTVCIFSEKPLEEIKYLYLDFHSKTSASLAPVLCREYWNVQPQFLPATPGFENHIGGDTAGLVIGDRAIGREKQFPFVYDLGEAWLKWTGLPFVFAAWVSTRPLNAGFIADFNAALYSGIAHIPELIQIIPAIPEFDIEAYFRQNISYALDDAKWLGLQRFLRMLPGFNPSRLHRSAAMSWSA
ncbi:MAG: menaquinone biosynthesis protein [Saprospirales bacterium]|jgi:chorismate dehydratase|nr:menaquinone biosynthesis protein [Saprospirales bacterium]